jgi:ATP-binding cassette, subfamily B, multidrug efflux pump
VLTRLTNDVDSLTEAFSSGAVTILSDAVTVLAVVGMMLVLDVRLTLYSFLVVPPLVLLTLVFRVYARRAFRAIRKHLARINTYLAEHIAGMAVVQAFGQEARTQREFAELNEAFRDANRTAILFDALLFAVVEAIGTAAVAAMLWFGAEDLTTGALGAGTFIAFVQYIRRFFIPIRDLSTKYTMLQAAFASAERVFSLLDEPLTIRSPPNPTRVTSLTRELSFERVWFSYADDPGEGDWALRDFELRVRKGEKVALVGATGSGKTTVLKLLGRSYDVQRGAVRVDGHDVRTLDLADLRRMFAVVLQDVHLFSGTVMDNLRFIDDLSVERVLEAARVVQVDEFVRRLPQGYDTPVHALGSNFSAGERQLLAFARALARDPQILVLDEATSNVDSETEARLQAALEIVSRERTAIIVAHRLSTVRRVDRIVVLQQGRVVEEGSHSALLAQGGVYRRLAELQFADTSL